MEKEFQSLRTRHRLTIEEEQRESAPENKGLVLEFQHQRTAMLPRKYMLLANKESPEIKIQDQAIRISGNWQYETDSCA